MKEINAIKEEAFVKENLQEFLKNLLFFYYKEMKLGKLENVTAINVVEKTKNNTGLTVMLCLNYGGRDEIIMAVNKLLKSGKKEI